MAGRLKGTLAARRRVLAACAADRACCRKKDSRASESLTSVTVVAHVEWTFRVDRKVGSREQLKAKDIFPFSGVVISGVGVGVGFVQDGWSALQVLRMQVFRLQV